MPRGIGPTPWDQGSPGHATDADDLDPPERISSLREYSVPKDSLITLPVRVKAGALEEGEWVTRVNIPGMNVVRQPLASIVSDPVEADDGTVEALVTVVNPSDESVRVPLGGDDWVTQAPTAEDEGALQANRVRGLRCARETSRTDPAHKAGWYYGDAGDRVLAIKNQSSVGMSTGSHGRQQPVGITGAVCAVDMCTLNRW